MWYRSTGLVHVRARTPPICGQNGRLWLRLLHLPNRSNGELRQAVSMVEAISRVGMKIGVSLNPSTPISDILPLLRTGLVDTVDVLAVGPGFGGQVFQSAVVDKIKELRSFREQQQLSFNIMVDGGINDDTASRVVESGADVLVAGSFLFRQGLRNGANLLYASIERELRPQAFES